MNRKALDAALDHAEKRLKHLRDQDINNMERNLTRNALQKLANRLYRTADGLDDIDAVPMTVKETDTNDLFRYIRLHLSVFRSRDDVTINFLDLGGPFDA